MAGGIPPGMSFPQKVHTEDEDFVIELDDSHMAPGIDNYGLDDRGRCKRRKRCGQCGPCQVKENCNKCHYCIRKDVLKQTCIYRKCIYLRSKPKPYKRPHQSPQARTGTSPSRDTVQAPTIVKSPLAHSTMTFPESTNNMPETRAENSFFPQQLPQQAQLGMQHNNGYLSPSHTPLDQTPSLPNTAGNITMQMSMSPHIPPNQASSPPVPKPPDPVQPHVPQPVNSPMAALPGIPVSSCNSGAHMSAMPSVGPSIPPVMPQMTNSALSSIPHIPPIPNMPGIGERTMSEFRHPDQFPLAPPHPHPAYPTIHSNVMAQAHRDSSLFPDPSRIPPMNFNPTNAMNSLGRGPNDSSCMYHPGLSYSMAGHYQPSGPSFLSGAEMNPFRSNFLNTFPPGYSYPPDRFREGFGSLPFSRLGISPSPSFPQYPGQNGGYGMGNSLSQQYYNSQHGCPKNGSCPPVSPHIDDVKVIQEGYQNNKDQCSKSVLDCDVVKQEKVDEDLLSPVSVSSDVSDVCSEKGRISRKDSVGSDTILNVPSPRRRSYDRLNMYYSPRRNSLDRMPMLPSPISRKNSLDRMPMFPPPCSQLSPRSDFLRPWDDFYMGKHGQRHDPFLSPASRYPFMDLYRMPPWFSPRRDDACSRASTNTSLSSDFESEIIGVDDQQVNALIRSDGCNSIEIEVDNRSMCSNESTPHKSRSSASLSDVFSPSHEMLSPRCVPTERERELSIRKAFNLFDSGLKNLATECKRTKSGIEKNENKLKNGESQKSKNEKSLQKAYFKDVVCIKQDLGDEGTIQVDLPGHRVSIENVVFTDDLLNNSSNVEELKEFIASGKTSSINTNSVVAN